MSVPCEVAVKCVLPAVRAIIAKELTTKHGLKQAEAAKLLGLSQPAISLYNREMRGKAINLEGDSDIKRHVERTAEALTQGSCSRRDLILTYCGICRTIRAKGLLCELHKAFDPSIDIETCELCANGNPFQC